MTSPGAHSLPVAKPGLNPVLLDLGFSLQPFFPAHICQEATEYQVHTVKKTHRVPGPQAASVLVGGTVET